MPVKKPSVYDTMRVMIDQFRLGQHYADMEQQYLKWEEDQEQYQSEVDAQRKKKGPWPKRLIITDRSLNKRHESMLLAWEAFAPVAPFYAVVQYWRYQDQLRKEKEKDAEVQTEGDEEEGLHQGDGLSVRETG